MVAVMYRQLLQQQCAAGVLSPQETTVGIRYATLSALGTSETYFVLLGCSY
jgi:hypothetical protein